MSRSRQHPALQVKRIYEPASSSDGYRVLVDRLWPRGITKERAHMDEWLKDVAPSDQLRRRVHAKECSWDEFVTAYEHELHQEPARSAVQTLLEQARQSTVTLLFSAKDETQNNALALKAYLERLAKG